MLSLLLFFVLLVFADILVLIPVLRFALIFILLLYCVLCLLLMFIRVMLLLLRSLAFMLLYAFTLSSVIPVMISLFTSIMVMGMLAPAAPLLSVRTFITAFRCIVVFFVSIGFAIRTTISVVASVGLVVFVYAFALVRWIHAYFIFVSLLLLLPDVFVTVVLPCMFHLLALFVVICTVVWCLFICLRMHIFVDSCYLLSCCCCVRRCYFFYCRCS